MRTERIEADFCVVGGGMAGVCAAVAAARGGARTVLVQDRPVLGGNASSEIRVWLHGATASGVNRYAREGGIVGELVLENMARNPEANAHLFDALMLEWVRREPNLRLLLDTAVFECARASNRVAAVSAFCALNQTRYEVSAALFADCSGDGVLGLCAGADFRVGREGRDETGESLAPEQADARTLGDSMFFYSRRHGHPVKFVAPDFAIDVTTLGLPRPRRQISGDPASHGCELWWVEYGGMLDTVGQADQIKWHLTRLVYGVWDYIKNSGKVPDTGDLTLEWVGSYPGKREGPRFLGPHVLTEQDVMAQRPFDDAVCTAGWSIDLHPSEGIYSTDAPSQHLHADWICNLPFRCLYSRNVDNLLLAGRLISATHVAFGSIRVMATGAVMGQAIGTAAAQMLADGIETPAALSADGPAVRKLQQRLLRDGQHVVGLRNADPDDLARTAAVTASTTAVLDERADDRRTLRVPKGFRLMLPIADLATDWAEVLLEADAPVELACEVAVNDKAVNYKPNVTVARHALSLAGGGPRWVRVPLPRLDRPQNVWLLFAANEHVAVHCSRRSVAGAMFEDAAHGHRHPRRYVGCPCLRLARPQRVYEPGNVIDGCHRPEVFPHAWVSAPLADGPQWIELDLGAERAIGLVQLALNADVNRHIVTALVESDIRVIGELVRDLDVELFAGDRPVGRFEVRDNHHQFVRIDAGGAAASRVRVTCLACHDHDRAEVHEVRVYAAGS